MDQTVNELVKDPVFQLNALLWLTQPLPVEAGIRPLLYRQGFRVYAIAPLLSLPPEVRLRVKATCMSIQDSLRPDVVLAKEDGCKFAFAECKATSFGSGININVDEGAHEFFGLPPGANPFIRRDPDTDPRPLYFIPYDPDVDQSEQEKALCKRILYERMHSTVIAAVGRAHPPAEIAFNSADVVNDATFGMYAHWENHKSQKKNMRRQCGYLMSALAKAVNAVSPGTVTETIDGNKQWIFHLQDQEQYNKVIDTLTRFSCETMDLQAEPQLTLFDGLEDELTGG